MTRSIQAQNSHTAARIEKLRQLIEILQAGQRRASDVCNLLKVGPTCVRRYVADLGGLIKLVREGAESVYRLVASAEKVETFLAGLIAKAAARPATPPRTPEGIAARDSRRHFHILADDEHYAVRVSRATPARDPMVAAFFGPAPAQMGAHV